MRFVDIRCVDGTTVGLTFHELRITEGFTKIYHRELGNFAIANQEVKEITIAFEEESTD